MWIPPHIKISLFYKRLTEHLMLRDGGHWCIIFPKSHTELSPSSGFLGNKIPAPQHLKSPPGSSFHNTNEFNSQTQHCEPSVAKEAILVHIITPTIHITCKSETLVRMAITHHNAGESQTNKHSCFFCCLIILPDTFMTMSIIQSYSLELWQ